jgi:hypothetical protein
MKIEISKYCKDCNHEYPVSDFCISCYDYNNFEEKEKVMSDIKLKESEFNEIKKFIQECYHSAVLDSMINNKAKEKGWIVEDEIKEAIEEYKNYSDDLRRRTYYPKIEEELLLINKCNTAIDLLQKRIQELEAGE